MKKTLTLLISFLVISNVFAQELSERLIQNWVLDAVEEMPSKGGYVLTKISPEKLRDAFSWQGNYLDLDPQSAVPSYCTTATFLVFYRVLQKYWDYADTLPYRSVLEIIKPNVEADGVRIWGRWNSNGPATAKFFADTRMGENFDDINQARPGDFLKLFWNGEIGKNERGHSVIYLGRETVNGVKMIRFWSSNKDTDGYGVRLIPITDAKKLLFSRLLSPENYSNIGTLPATDDFLSSMLRRESNWNEVRQVSGIQP